MKQQILSALPSDHPWRSLVHYLDETDSTNDRIKAMARQGAPHGTVVVAQSQTDGKGRLGRSFHSPSGMGLYISFLLRLPCSPDNLMHLTCAAAVAACDATEKAAGIRPGIKWTNDLVVGGKKLGGILTELVTAKDGTFAVVGIGINCRQSAGDFPPDISDMACSLAMAGAHDPSPAALAAELITAIERISRDLLDRKAELLERYRKDCITVGKDICIVRNGEVLYGRATGIDDAGGLVVTCPDGSTETVRYGEVSVRGMYGYV